MKKILSIVVVSILVFSSCRNTTTDTTTSDSIVTDTIALAPNMADSVAIVNEEVMASENTEDQPSLGNENFDYTFEGTINGQIKVKVNIFYYNQELKARAVYLNTKKIIDMDAAYPAVGTFVLTEKINGKATGEWKLESEEEDIFTGTWTSPDGTKKMPITVSMTPSPEEFDDFLPAEEIRSGFYEYTEVNQDPESKEEFPTVYNEALYVKNMAGNSIYFDLYIQGPPPGVHIGMINGIANKSGKNYVYKNDEGCEITMAFTESNVTLTQKGTDFNCEFGANISAFGTLKKK